MCVVYPTLIRCDYPESALKLVLATMERLSSAALCRTVGAECLAVAKTRTNLLVILGSVSDSVRDIQWQKMFENGFRV